MYTEQDMIDVNARLRRGWLGLIPVLVVLAAAYVYGLAARHQWLSMAAGALLFIAFTYAFLTKLWPLMRYRTFLRDMDHGLSRDVRGTVLAISDEARLQDGAMVLPVRLRLEQTEEVPAQLSAVARRLEAVTGENIESERIVYLNASKRDGFPKPGTAVVLHCFGRHVKAVEAL